jgi:Fe-S-cluster containining protein
MGTDMQDEANGNQRDDVHGAPLVVGGYHIDPRLLELRAITRCRVQQCRGACCADGVWLDYDHSRRILDNAALIQPFMPEDRRDVSTWFAELHDDDPAFPSGRYTGTTTVEDPTHPSGTTCRFLRPEDRYCAIQAASMAHGLDAWDLKPYYCRLFPIVDQYVDEHDRPLPMPMLTIDDENDLFSRGGTCSEACATTQPVFQVYAEEVAHVLGLAGYRRLCEMTGQNPRL